MDVDPNAIISTAQWKTVRVKRATEIHINTMVKGSRVDKKALVSRIIAEW